MVGLITGVHLFKLIVKKFGGTIQAEAALTKQFIQNFTTIKTQSSSKHSVPGLGVSGGG